MNTIIELKKKLTEYTNPQNLGDDILKSLTKELYVKNKKEYNKIAHKFYSASLRNDRALSATILCNWMECSDFKDVEGLDYLNSRSDNIAYVCDAYCSLEVKYKVLILWCSQPRYETMNVSDLLVGIVQRTRTKKLRKKTSDPQFELDDLHKLRLITELVKTYKDCLRNENLKVAVNMNLILNTLNMEKLPAIELLKVMAFYPYLNKPILTKLAKLYPEGRFDSLLSTAKALDIVDNPDYWIQSLTTHINKPNEFEALPEL